MTPVRKQWGYVLLVALLAGSGWLRLPLAQRAEANRKIQNWIGTWAAAPQAPFPMRLQVFSNQTLRLVVHTSAGGRPVRVRISNAFGDQPLLIGSAQVARRNAGADIDPASDRTLTFRGRAATTIAPRSTAISDPADLDVPPLSDLAVSLFFPQATPVSTLHILALETNYVSAGTGDSTSAAKFPVGKTISFWPFLTGADVEASPGSAAIVAFGSSTTDGDGSAQDANRRWPDVLAERLQKDSGRSSQLGVLNEGIIGNRLLSDFHSPHQQGGPFEAAFNQLGPGLGPSGLTRFEPDVLDQAGVKYVISALGINDILFPGSFIPEARRVSAEDVISGNRQLVARARKKGIRVLGTTIPPFENATFHNPVISFFTPEKEKVRQQVNAWVRSSGEFDGVIDFDEVVRDPGHPTQLLPEYDSGDHLHVNDAGNIAQGNAIPLSWFR
jgi:lysophospholipase L1-like esterase